VRLLDSWEASLTWDLFAKAISTHIGGQYARQTLDRHVRIKEAYLLAKERLGRKKNNTGALTSKEVARRLQDYERMKNEVERLERENNSYAMQFARWVWNLRQMKISEDQLSRLDKELPESLRT
jgi:uncharacterized protein YigA (DUF484 family)